MPPASNRAHRRQSRRGASATNRRRKVRCARSCRSARRRSFRRWQTSRPKATDWINEIKFDGYRLLCWLDHGKVRVVTRNGLDWTDRLPAVARAVEGLRAEAALVDGELVALDKQGASSFPALQAALSAGKDATLHLFLFDLLHLDGWDLRACKLLDRKRVLSDLSDWRGMLRYSDHHVGDAASMQREVCRMGLEGIICKQVDAPYRAGRGHGWVKVKCRGREEFVVLGWTPPGGSRKGLGSLHRGLLRSAAAGCTTPAAWARVSRTTYLRCSANVWPNSHPTRRSRCSLQAIRCRRP